MDPASLPPLGGAPPPDEDAFVFGHLFTAATREARARAERTLLRAAWQQRESARRGGSLPGRKTYFTKRTEGAARRVFAEESYATALVRNAHVDLGAGPPPGELGSVGPGEGLVAVEVPVLTAGAARAASADSDEVALMNESLEDGALAGVLVSAEPDDGLGDEGDNP